MFRLIKWFAIVAGVSLVLLFSVILLLPVTVYINAKVSNKDFNSAEWQHDLSGDRVYMVDDLLATHPLVGQTSEQVEALLGKPPRSDYFRGQCDWLYWLGPERGFIAIDSEWLCLRFKNNVIVEGKIVRD